MVIVIANFGMWQNVQSSIRFCVKRNIGILGNLSFAEVKVKSEYQEKFYVASTSKTDESKDLFDYNSPEHIYHRKLLTSNSLYFGSIAFLDSVSVNNNQLATDEAESPSSPRFSLSDKSALTLVSYLRSLITSNKISQVWEQDFLSTLCNNLESRLDDLIEDNILLLLKILILWPQNVRNQPFFNLCRQIDGWCLSNSLKFSLNKKLLIVDHFFRIGVIRYSEFTWCVMVNLNRRLSKLTTQQLIQFFFFGNTYHQWHPCFNVFATQHALMQHIAEISAEEFGIVALSFIKTRAPIHNKELVKKIYEKLYFHVDDLHPTTLNCYLKLLRHVTPLSISDYVEKLFKILRNDIEKLSFESCLLVCQLGSNLIVYDQHFINKIIEMLILNISNASLKDIEDVCSISALFNVDNPYFYRLILSEIQSEKRMKELSLRNNYHSYVNILYSLSLKGIYHKDCLDLILSEDYLKVTRGKSLTTVSNEFKALVNSVKIECPQYHSNQSNPELYTSIATVSSHKNDVKKISCCDKILTEAGRILEISFGSSEYVHVTHVIPHYTHSNIIFCLDANAHPLILPKTTRRSHLRLSSPPDIGTWYAVIFMGLNTTIHGSNSPTGYAVAQKRQLQVLGYKIIELFQSEWMLLDNDNSKLEYIVDKTKEQSTTFKIALDQS